MKNIFVSLICQYNLPIMKELLYLKDDQLKDLIEKLFVIYRETFSDSKKILDRSFLNKISTSDTIIFS